MTDKKPITHKVYMQSSYWSKLSREIRSDPDAKCAICGRPSYTVYKVGSKKGKLRRLLTLQCHHIRYDNMSFPELEKKDIITLCANCHSTAHDIQKLAKRFSIWEKVYQTLLDNSAWFYEENVKKEYMVRSDFKIPQKRKKKE